MNSDSSEVDSESELGVESEVERATSLIENADLPHPSGELLLSFVTEAINPSSAAAFVLQECHASSAHDNRAELLDLVKDWTYIVECGQSRSPHVACVNI